MQQSRSQKIYCPDIQCGYESISSAGSVPIKTRRHRQMVYSGTRHIGFTSLAFRSFFDPDTALETGTYHLYSCPVCGQEATVLEKRGVKRRFA